MKAMESKIAAMVFGPPGSGKGTQADLMADRYNLIHFDTGKNIERVVHDPKNIDDLIIRRERKLFDSGSLNTPEWVLELVGKKIKEIVGDENKGVVFSGSPRTMYEARGDKGKNIPGVISVLEDSFGKENIFAIKLNVPDEVSIFRNSHRRVCEICQTPLLYNPENEKLTNCPACGGKIITRIFDTPQKIKVRLEQYQNRTKPIFEFIESRGLQIIDIDGEPAPEIVAKNILKEIDKRLLK